MRYRPLGKTGINVSEIGLGAEWLSRHTEEECIAVIHRCQDNGINILDCWMSDPNIRTNIGKGIRGSREKWYIQGHVGSAWINGQYVRTRDIPECKKALRDLLDRLNTDYIDFGMIHYIDSQKEWDSVKDSGYMDYILDLKRRGVIRHIGMSTHNPKIALQAAKTGIVEMFLFALNPAFDMLPAGEDVDAYYDLCHSSSLDGGISPERAEFYRYCGEKQIGINVMKTYEGGRLLNAKDSPFGVALSTVQCIHYALTRPAVASVLVGYESVEHVSEALRYETATDEEKDYASVLASAPRHAFSGLCTYCGHCAPCPKQIDIAMVNKLYDLAAMQPEVPDSVRGHYMALEHRASECISCRGCETRCPFGVKVADRMQKAAALFE